MFGRFKKKKKEENEDGLSVNKKVIGAKKTVIDGIEFRSTLEGNCYKLLKASGLRFQYESEQCVLWHGFKDENIFVWKRIGDKFARRVMKTTLDWTYTPDFVITSRDGMSKIYVEAKGNPTDLTPYKTKVFLGYLHKLSLINGKHYEYAFVKNLKELQYVINELKKEENCGKYERRAEEEV